jgi:hypothetical protein
MAANPLPRHRSALIEGRRRIRRQVDGGRGGDAHLGAPRPCPPLGLTLAVLVGIIRDVPSAPSVGEIVVSVDPGIHDDVNPLPAAVGV